MLETLKSRFRANMDRHPDLSWELVESRLQGNETALAALRHMEESGGEPDVIGFFPGGDRLLFCDCSKETPVGRRSLCYDEEALKKRAKNPQEKKPRRRAKQDGKNQ